MTILWVIEKPTSEGTGPIAQSLIGDYPVRTFGSLDSFITLMKLDQGLHPAVILVSEAACSQSATRVSHMIRYHLPETQQMFLGKFPDAQIKLPTVFFASETTLGLTLSLKLREILSHRMVGGSRSSNVVKYKDIIFDSYAMNLKILPHGESTSLTMKEACILRFLMENRGRCLSRKDINNRVWSGVAVSSRTIDSHISRLRRRFKESEVEIESVYGGGYLLR